MFDDLRARVWGEEAAFGGSVSAFFDGLFGGDVDEERATFSGIAEAEDGEVGEVWEGGAEVELVLDERFAGDGGESDLVGELEGEEVDGS